MNETRWMLVFISLAVLSLCLYFIAFRKMRKKFVVFTEEICDGIDLLLQGGGTEELNISGETLTSKIMNKLERLDRYVRGVFREKEQQRQALQQTVSDISHQLKTPMSNLLMYNDTLLQREMEPEKQREFLLAMRQQEQKMEFLVAALVKMSRLENEMIRLKMEVACLDGILSDVFTGLELKIKEKQIQFSVESNKDINVRCDRKWASEAMFNILDNAVKYTPAGGSIKICVIPMEMYTRIDFQDNGIGVSKAHYNDIFKRFYREEKVHDKEGVGIGLYLAREIMTRQGGYIKVSSNQPSGSIFSVYLQSSR